MAKFVGTLGFAERVETAPDVWRDAVTERPYTGDLTKYQKQYQPGESVNDDLTLQNGIEIVYDDYLLIHHPQLKYVEYAGVKWKVRSIEPARPRLKLQLGGVYNG